jgi:hypothetical protein
MAEYPITAPCFEEIDYGAYVSLTGQSVTDNGSNSYTINFNYSSDWILVEPYGYGHAPFIAGVGLFYIGEWSSYGEGEYRYWGWNDASGPLYGTFSITGDLGTWETGSAGSIEVTFSIVGSSPTLFYYFSISNGDPSISTFDTNSDRPYTIGNAATITTLAADQIGYAGPTARLNGTGGAGFTYNYFQYSPNTALLNLSTSQKAGATNFNQFISGLSPGVTYYFRAVGKTGVTLTYGSTLNFVSAGAVAPLQRYAFLWVEGTKLRLNTDT